MKALRFALPAAFALSTLMLGACEQDRMNNVPAGATMTTSGNANLSYTAQYDGTVWVYDVNDDRIDYSGQLNANQSITVNSSNNQIQVDGRVAGGFLGGGELACVVGEEGGLEGLGAV